MQIIHLKSYSGITIPTQDKSLFYLSKRGDVLSISIKSGNRDVYVQDASFVNAKSFTDEQIVQILIDVEAPIEFWMNLLSGLYSSGFKDGEESAEEKFRALMDI